MKETGKIFPFPVPLSKLVLIPHILVLKNSLFYNGLVDFFRLQGLARWFGMVFAN